MTTRRLNRANISRQLTGWAFVSPLLLGIGIFSFYPLIRVLIMGFEYHNGFEGHWVGLENYRYLAEDGQFLGALKNTVVMGLLDLAFGLPLGLIVALLLHYAPFGASVFRSAVFAPHVISIVATAMAFTVVFHPSTSGPANQLLGLVGLEPSGWFADTSVTQLSVVLMGLWHGTGFIALIYLTGMQNVSSDLLEAARIDGANLWQEWRHVVVPLLRPITVFLVVMSVIGAFKRFGEVFVIGGEEGSPGGMLDTLMLYIYRLGFASFQFGLAAAASTVVFLLILLVTVLNLRLLSGWARD